MKRSKEIRGNFVGKAKCVKRVVFKHAKGIKGFIALALVVVLVGISLGATLEAFGAYEVASLESVYEEEVVELPAPPEENSGGDADQGSASGGGAEPEECQVGESNVEEDLPLEESPSENDELEEGLEEQLLDSEEYEYGYEYGEEEYAEIEALGFPFASGHVGGTSDALWEMCEDGIVTVGPGTIQSALSGSARISPWSAYSEDVTKIIFTEPVEARALLTRLFSDLPNLVEIVGLENINTSNTTHMGYMFQRSGSLGSLNLGTWNVSNVTSMTHMFSDAVGLATISGLGNWNTSRLENTSNMFGRTSSLSIESLQGVQGWNMGSVTNMASMFSRTGASGPLNLSAWNVSSATNMSSLFYNAHHITCVGNLSGWNTGNVNNMRSMFHQARSLTKIEGLQTWNTSRVTTMHGMFANAENLVCVGDISNWDTGNVTTMWHMFGGTRIATLDLSRWNTGNVVIMTSMFYRARELTSIGDISAWNTSSAVYMSNMFRSAQSLANIGDLRNWNTSNVRYMDRMFMNAWVLQTIGDVSAWDTSRVVDMRYMFSDARVLEQGGKLNLSGWNTANVRNMTNMFNRTSMAILYLTNWCTGQVTNMDHLFRNSNRLRVLNFGENWNVIAGADVGLRLVDENAPFTGHWQNVAYGLWNYPAVDQPRGDETYRSPDLMLGNAASLNTWVWQRRVATLRVDFESDGNGVVNAPTPPFTLLDEGSTIGADLLIAVLPNAHFLFSHWVSDQHYGEFGTNEIRNLVIESDTVFTAIFVPIIHPVEFFLNGGNVNGVASDVRHEIKQGNLVTESNVPVPIRPGYRFLGWYQYNSPAGPPILSADTIAAREVVAPLAFEAQWERIVTGNPDVPCETETNEDNNRMDGNDEEHGNANGGNSGAGGHPIRSVGDTESENKSPQTGDSELPIVRYLISALVSIFVLRLLLKGRREDTYEQLEN